MNYRPFGSLDFQVSALGFGAMRLPSTTAHGTPPQVDETESIRMIHRAIERGVNYIDTAYPYHDGISETVVGKAVHGTHRHKVRLATKSPVWYIQKPEDFDRFLEEQLRKLQTETIDFYLLHALNRERWHDIILRHSVLARAEAALRAGKIRHLGFSFHDLYEGFPEILNGYNGWSFCQIQYNYMDTENQAGTQGLALAAQKGLGVVVMEPLLGGRLTRPPQSIADVMARASHQRTPVGWALDWLWNQPEVSVVLSGMSSMDQLEENLSLADTATSGAFTPADHEVIAFAQRTYRERTVVPCTQCGYCVPCPNGVDIPVNFRIFNDGHLYDDIAGARFWYRIFLGNARGAAKCIQCEDCEGKCPQKIPISTWMPRVAETLDV